MLQVPDLQDGTLTGSNHVQHYLGYDSSYDDDNGGGSPMLANLMDSVHPKEGIGSRKQFQWSLDDFALSNGE